MRYSREINQPDGLPPEPVYYPGKDPALYTDRLTKVENPVVFLAVPATAFLFAACPPLGFIGAGAGMTYIALRLHRRFSAR